MKWIVVIFVALIVLISTIPTLSKWGLGRLPGDIHCQLGRFKIEIPLMSTLLISLICIFLVKLL